VHQRRRASAEESRGQGPALEEPSLMAQVGEKGFAPFVLIDLRSNVAVEVASGAFRNAEGPVNVEGEAASYRLREGERGWERRIMFSLPQAHPFAASQLFPSRKR